MIAVRLGLVLGMIGLVFAEEPPRVVRITPAGEDVPAERQVVIQFDRPVVPLGRMERQATEVPVVITPDPGCSWRWLDRSTLACQLGEQNALRPATRYVVEVRGGEPFTQTFVTQRPHVENFWFTAWHSPGTPEVQLMFDQAVDQPSVEQHVVFRPAGGTPVAVEAEPMEEVPTGYVLRPVQELPADHEVALHVEPGIRTAAGGEPGVEQRDLITFRTFPEPRFVRIACNGQEHAGRCDPDLGARLVFSSPVAVPVLQKGLLITPPLAAWDDLPVYSQLQGLSERHEYSTPLPGPLQPFTEYRITAKAGSLRDEFDRPIPGAIDVRFKTDHRRPDLDLDHPSSVLESRVDTHLPVRLTNLEGLQVTFDRITAEGVVQDERVDLTLPRAQDVRYRYPLRVRDWLHGDSGAVIGRIAAKPKLPGEPRWFFSAVSQFGVHVKLGHFGSLVWVTDLTTGAPVGGAQVELLEQQLTDFDRPFQALAEARTDEQGLASLPGTEKLDPEQKRLRWWQAQDEPHVWVRVRLGDELAIFPLATDFRVDGLGPGRRWIARDHEPRHGHLKAWGATAQGIYRAGDTVQYKVWVRDESERKLTTAPERGWTLKVVDPLDHVVHERADVALSEFGALDGTFVVPRTGAVGWYRFELRADFAKDRTWQPLTVLVSDFTPAPFRVATEVAAERVRIGDTVRVTTRATLHAGGPYASAPSRLTAIVRALPFQAADPELRGFVFPSSEEQEEILHQSEGDLDTAGERVTELEARGERVLYGELTVESSVRDDRGRSVASRATARYAARDRYVGVQHEGWVLTAGTPAAWRAVVTDETGRVVPGVPVELTVEQLVTHAARVRGAGNAYLTQYEHTWEVLDHCSRVSETTPVSCSFTPPAAGGYRMKASIADTAARPVESEIERWAVGSGFVLWEEPPGHHLDVVTESSNLHVGDTARYLVKNPFPGATALVTIERYGILSRFTQRLDDSTAMIEFPVEPDYVPGFYLSVVVASPRVEQPLGDDGVDLGKPAFRIGYAEAEVRDVYKELDVEVHPTAEVLRPRETAGVDVRVRTRQGEVVPTELAVAVVDEAVLDLVRGGAKQYDPYAGFYELGGLDVWNFNLIKNLIGIQRFEKKGATPGGDGGLDPALRSQFRFVAYWNPSLVPDADGRAHFEFTLPDNLTGWRVLVMAATREDRLGLGQASFKVSQDTELRPALPNRVVEGDRFEARFSVMNRTDRTRRLSVEASAEGAVRGHPKVSRALEVGPFERQVFGLAVQAAAPGPIRFRVKAGDRADQDALAVELGVEPSRAKESVAQFGSTTEAQATEALAFPRDVRPGSGELRLALGATVLGGLGGLFESMRDYPYSCWEQRISRAVAAAQFVALGERLPADTHWPGAAAIPAATLEQAADFQTPSGAMAFYEPRDEYASPYLSAYTALAFGWLRELGHSIPPGVEGRLHDYLLDLLRRDRFPEAHTPRMAATVRAVALAALSAAGKLDPGELSRWRDHVAEMDLFGLAHYLAALGHDPHVLDSILTHATESAGQIGFTETLDEGYELLLHSEKRTDCAVLLVLARSGESTLAPKLARSVSAGRWQSTQESLYCAQALIAYAKTYESEPPDLEVTARVGRERLGTATLTGPTSAVELVRGFDRSDAGRPAELQIERQGQGRLYWALRLAWSPRELPTAPILAGLEVRRRYQVQREGNWVDLTSPARLAPGDLVRVQLELAVPVLRHYLVVDDPLAGALEPVSRELATASEVDADAAGPQDWVFYHRELRHDRARFYAETVPPGSYTLSYTAQVIAPGEFTASPPRIEAMYEPDVFGQGLPARFVIE